MGDPPPEDRDEDDGAPSAAPWRRRLRKPVVAMAIAALGGIVTFAVREGLTSWNERRQAPMIVSIEPYEAAYDGGFQMAFGPGFQLNAVEESGLADCGDLHGHLASRGGVDVGSTYLVVTLQGDTDRAVSVEGMRFEIDESAEPITDVYVECAAPASGGLASPILAKSTGLGGLSGVSGNLDDPTEPPIAFSKDGLEGEFLADSSLTIVNGETVKLLVEAHACGCNCAWRLALDLLVDGEPQTFALMPEAASFRTTGDVAPEAHVSWDPEEGAIADDAGVSSTSCDDG